MHHVRLQQHERAHRPRAERQSGRHWVRPHLRLVARSLDRLPRDGSQFLATGKERHHVVRGGGAQAGPTADSATQRSAGASWTISPSGVERSRMPAWCQARGPAGSCARYAMVERAQGANLSWPAHAVGETQMAAQTMTALGLHYAPDSSPAEQARLFPNCSRCLRRPTSLLPLTQWNRAVHKNSRFREHYDIFDL